MAASPSRQPRDSQLEERLIEAVRRRRPLWDSTTPLHKNVRVLMYCWKQIAEELDLKETTAKKKWKSLRDYFFKQVKDIEKSGCGFKADDNTRYTLWPYFDLLKFLVANKKNYTDYNAYKMSDEEKHMLVEICERDKRQRNNTETSVHVPRRMKPKQSSEQTPNILSGNDPEQNKTTDQSIQCQVPSLIVPEQTPLQDKSIIHPETMNKVTVCEPPPLRVFKQAPSILNSLLTRKSSTHRKPPCKKFKYAPDNVHKQSEMEDTEFDSDLHFFKSLLPFMWALPLKNKLHVRNRIQDLILRELDAVGTKDNVLAMTSQRNSSVDEDTLIIPDVEDAGLDEESLPNLPVVVKEELEENETFIFEVDSESLIFASDDNSKMSILS